MAAYHTIHNEVFLERDYIIYHWQLMENNVNVLTALIIKSNYHELLPLYTAHSPYSLSTEERINMKKYY